MSSRRRFLSLFPAAIAAGASTRALAQQPQQPPRVSREAITCAEDIIGIDFTDEQAEAMRRGLSTNLNAYEQLRKMDIPNGVEPAVHFTPYLPGRKPTGASTPHARLRLSRQPALRKPARLEDVAFWPVTALARLIERREITSTDLTKMYLERLKTHGPALFNVVTLTEELALQQAAAADRDIRAGRYRGPLHGIPWGAKDLFATKGIRTTWGAKPYENQVIDYDATVVERLREAGAVLVAKLSMGALAQGGDWFGGRTRNPWNVERSSSGSSAGPGSATAAGLVGFALGTETRGSIVSPSAENGVVGLRPTYGRVSRYGAMALSWTMDKIGPMCRTVEDCAIAFNAIYGSDGRDTTVVDAPFVWAPDTPMSRVRIGYVKSEIEDVPERMNEEQRKNRMAMNALMMDAVDVFRKLGAQVEPVSLPDFPSNALNFILSAEAAASFDELTRRLAGGELTEESLGTWPGTFRTARFVPAVEYIRAQQARTLMMREWGTLMQGCDVILSSNQSASLGATNLTGHPSLTMKAGFLEGRPRPLMLTGRLYDEATMLRIGLAYERATDWDAMHPKVN
ncbi:MAG TPA: amidase [Vicinamibacterales bacterium]|nr:amidase [Vicinamibacterales bacterium]